MIRFLFEGNTEELLNTAKGLDPKITLALDYDKDVTNVADAYDIVVLEGLPLPSGQYGADSLSTALEEVNTRVIEGSKNRFRVTYVPSGTPGGRILCERSPAPADSKPGTLRFDEGEAAFFGLVKTPGKTLRFFVRQAESGAERAKPTPWRKLPVGLRMGTGPFPIDAVLEEYERPFDIRFDPLQLGNVTEASAGLTYFLEPIAKATLDKLRVEPVTDRKRRAGIRLRWQARPDGLGSSPKDEDAWRMVGGFHLFDMTHPPFDAGEPIAAPITVALLPQSAQGLEPSEMGDLSLIEAAYPTDAVRRIWRRETNCTGWFSPAESVPLFPDPNIFRRSLMPSVDEGFVASLFEKGQPHRLRFPMQLSNIPKSFITEDRKEWYLEKELFEPRHVRQLLQEALLDTPLADGANVEVIVKDQRGNVLVKKVFKFEACRSLHPVLADTLDLIRYSELSPDNPGRTYRRYEVVFDPPPAQAKKFEGWLDAAPEQRDPYGWTILRTLGLAEGFRLYDTETGTFLAGADLVQRTDSAFQRAIKRYEDWDIGAPFGDLLTAPMETARAFSFDSGPESTASDAAEILEKQLSVIQIALRPRIRSLVKRKIIAIRSREGFQPGEYTIQLHTGAVEVKVLHSDDGYWFSSEPEFEMAKFGQRETIDLSGIKKDQICLVVHVDDNGAGFDPLSLFLPEFAHRFEVVLKPEPEPVRYFIAAAKAASKPRAYGFTLVHPKFDVDLIALGSSAPAAARASLTLATDPKQDNARLALGTVTKDQSIFLIRVISRDGFPAQDNLGGILNFDSGLLETMLVDFTEEADSGARLGEALGTLPPLESAAWARQFFGSTLSNGLFETRHEALKRLIGWVERPAMDERPAMEFPPKEFDRIALAGKIVNWWKRFLDHGIGLVAEVYDPERHCSVGTIGKPGTWRMPEASDGTVGVFLTEESQYGAVKRFLVRPYSRYQAFLSAIRREAKSPETPPRADEKNLVDVTLPRTAPLAKPVILSASRVPLDATNPEAEVLELAVARTPDEVISSANQTTALALGAAGISVGFWREFSEPKWALELLKNVDFSAALGNWDKPTRPKALTLSDQALTGLRQRVPDAWLGTWVYRMQSLPYFYRVHALVYSSAGVVISEPASVTFPTGISVLRLDQAKPKPTYSVVSDQSGVMVHFNLPLIAFRDCMLVATIWDAQGDYEKLALLPDPSISYRIALAAFATGDYTTSSGALRVAEKLSSDPQFTLSASLGEDHKQYWLQQIGERLSLELDPKDPKKRVSAERIDGTNRWQLSIDAQLAKPREGFKSAVAFDCLQKTVAPDQFTAWRLLAPVGSAVLKYAKPATPKEEADLRKYCEDYLLKLKAYFGGEETPVAAAMGKILELPESQEFALSGWILGAPIPAHVGLQFRKLDFAWNPRATGASVEREIAHRVFADNNCHGEEEKIVADLFSYFIAAHKPLFKRPVAPDVFTTARNCTLHRSLDVIAVLFVKGRQKTYTADQLKDLIEGLESSVAGSAAIEALKSKTDPTSIAWPASAESQWALLQKLFVLTDHAECYIVAVRLPVSQEIGDLPTGPFQDSAAELAREAWFGPSRTPWLEAVRGTSVPLLEEIEFK
jgi:hypothetical protein